MRCITYRSGGACRLPVHEASGADRYTQPPVPIAPRPGADLPPTGPRPLVEGCQLGLCVPSKNSAEMTEQ